MWAIRRGYDGKEYGVSAQWTFTGAFLYSLTVITTIGYGNTSAKTYFGKTLTILFAIIGIPLMLLFLTNIGDVMAKIFRYRLTDNVNFTDVRETKSTRVSQEQILGDGNCLFRCFSVVITGTENHHVAVRREICKHMENDENGFWSNLLGLSYLFIKAFYIFHVVLHFKKIILDSIF